MQGKINKLIQIIQTGYYFKALLSYRVAAGVEHIAVFKYLGSKEFHTVADIGANRGQFALVARECFPGAKIYSFEPLKEPAGIFRRVFSSDGGVVLHEIAIGSEDTDMVIHVSRADDSSSLLPIASLQSSLFPGTEEKEERKITVRRLETILHQEDIIQPALLKIDVQGFELDALEGCKALLSCFSYIYVECSFMELYVGQALAHEVISFLEERGFGLVDIYNLYYSKNGLAVQGDFLFKRKTN